MGSLFLSIFLLITQITFAQNHTAKFIKTFISDTASRFKSIKGDFLEEREFDSLFSSRMGPLPDVEGRFSIGNDDLQKVRRGPITVEFNAKSYMYWVTLKDGLNKKEGKKQADKWADYFHGFLSGFKRSILELKKEPWRPAVYGWSFIRGSFSSDIILYPAKENNWYYVTFSISWSPDYYIWSQL